jgi:hypothetical protein
MARKSTRHSRVVSEMKQDPAVEDPKNKIDYEKFNYVSKKKASILNQKQKDLIEEQEYLFQIA